MSYASMVSKQIRSVRVDDLGTRPKNSKHVLLGSYILKVPSGHTAKLGPIGSEYITSARE